MSSFRTLDDLDLDGKTVLVRADLNVPMQNGAVSDDTRIQAVVPTIRAILDAGGKVAVLSHFGRPKGQVVPEASLEPIAQPLADLVGTPVGFAPDCVGPAASEAINRNDITLLQNLRYHAGEEANDRDFAAQLAALADAYVNDAFSVSHRAHASVEAITHLLPSAAGLAMARELDALEKALGAPEKPVAALVGGAKVSTKLDVLGALVERVDVLIIGGGMANTFLFAQGKEVGASLCEKRMADTALAITWKAESVGCKIILPTDAVVAQELAVNVPTREASLDQVDGDDMILDIGPRTVDMLNETLATCRTLLWNGPLGAFEVAGFDRGTVAVAREAARLTGEGKLLSVAGGGDTVAALNHAGVADQFSYVSTAGGAFLEWLEGKELPGVRALAK
ncbi:MAG: phosphoglycerate kinase [Alphaproteobacteria bacterium]